MRFVFVDKILQRFSYEWGWKIIIIIAVVAAGWGGINVIKTIKSPFQLEVKDENKIAVESELDKLAELRKKDTDKDGLPDYDELYIYKTSPYLEDSDSDGFLDKTEIETGNDPNCPAGQNCLLDENVNNSGIGAANIQADLSPAEIRALLIEQGADANVINSVDDQTLLNLYQESIQELQNEQADIAAPSDSQFSQDQITPQQLRQELIKAGMSPETLSQVSDEELWQAYLEVVNQSN